MKGAFTNTHFSENQCLHERLVAIAEHSPNESALIYRNKRLTFAELNEQSNVLAQYLQSLGVQKGDFVALCLDRSLEMFIGIFGILKSGAAYVPIDVDYPIDRLRFMIEDANAKVILTQTSLKENLPDTSAEIIDMHSNWSTIKAICSAGKYNAISTPDDLAYMIYTSGSTGKPKGVMIKHRNVMNQLEGQQSIAPAPIGRMLLTCSISFDVSVTTIFWALLQGAPLVLPEQGEEKDIAKLVDTIHRNTVSHILTLPSLHTLILEQADPKKLASLRLVNVAGEVCPTPMAQKHEKLIPHAQLYNLYGPTEATVTCTYFTLPKGFSEAKVPIGKPILNYEIFILDEKLQEVAEGETGEIYIGGSKSVVASGYWNRPELSAERFVDNPHEAQRGGEKLYKTGDLARWMPDGNIEFLGRADYQVKFRGFRIELGEIEVAIGNHEAVKETVVLLKNQHEVHQQRLVAYLVLEQEQDLNVSELRSFLEEHLPDYMLPSHFVFLDKMPLTTNGKFDRKALPDPPAERPNLAQPYNAASTALEKYIVEQWETLLQLSPVGVNDKFFELGGNSIQAAQFIGNLQDTLEVSIFVTTIFDCPTIEEYALMLEKQYPEAIQKLFASEETVVIEEQEAQVLTEATIEQFEQYVPLMSAKIPEADEDTPKNPPAVFILAPPRSGTSLLRIMLAGHPELFAVNELQLLGFHTMQERREAYSGKFKLWLEGAVRTVMELNDCDADEAKSIVNKYESEEYTTKAFFKEIQNWVGDKMLVDKSPSYVLDPKALQKAERDFENPIYIHLIRHPYSMVTSFVKYHMDQVLYMHQHNFSARALGELVWIQSHKNTVAFLEGIPENRQFRIVYEDLVTKPEETMRALCATIGLEYHPNLLAPYQDLDTKLVDGIYKDSHAMSDTNFFKHKKINAEKAKGWTKVKEDNFLSDTTWDLALQFGYPSLEQLEEKPVETPISNPEPETPKAPETATNDIAIIGMSVRVAGADTLEQFWTNLVNGTDVGKTITAEDLERAGLDPALLDDPNYVKRSYSLRDADSFDASFFGYLPKEASMMDPQHRVFLETAYSALESSGYNPAVFNGKIGVYGGVARNSYFTNNIATHPELLETSGEYMDTLASEKSFSITRVAYKLNLKGPAVNIQTACSSSGVAIHMACQALLSGDADIIIAGGGRIQPPIDAGYAYTEGGPLSPDGYIRAFDAEAKGMVRGNGMAMLVLKKVDQAIKDGDHIWAVIKGTAINNDGSEKIGFTAPSIKGQADAIMAAHQKAGITADSIDYVETHGTGTILGDPIEMQGLSTAFKNSTDKQQFCAIGSVKTNIGHLDAGACAVGIVKTALAMKFEFLPPSLNYKQPNPQIDFKNSPFYVNEELKRWQKGERIRRAGVSSFGLGGTNVHVVIEESPATATSSNDPSHSLLTLSAKTETALEQSAQNLAYFFQANPEESLSDVGYTMAMGRQDFGFRRSIVAESALDAITQLQKVKAKTANTPNSTVFMFPGGGAQYVDMARHLYEANETFKGYVDDCLAILEEKEKLFARSILYPADGVDRKQVRKVIEQPANALATLLTIEYALAKTWMDWGIQPTQMIGHSMGEYTAACIAGVFTIEEALSLVTLRGRLFESLPAEGGMLGVLLSPQETEAYLGEDLTISVINRPNSCVVSGTIEAIDDLEQRLNAAEVDCTRIHISVAAHSPQIDPILGVFRSFLEKMEFKQPTIPFISNVTGTWAKPEEVCTPEYWIKHIRQTVRFSDGLATLFELKNALFLEVGPGQVLSTFARQHPKKNSKQVILASVRHPKEPLNDLEFIYKTVGKLWENGLPINWEAFYANQSRLRVSTLPTYPFERKRFWIEPNKATKPVPVAAAPQPTVQADNTIPLISTTPTMDFTNTPVTTNPIPRRDRIALELKNIFFELSGLEPDEMEDDATFLELGFDSLFLTQAITEVNNVFESSIAFRQLFEEVPTIGALAEHLDETLPEGKFDEPEPQPAPPMVQQPVQPVQPMPQIDPQALQNGDLGTALANAISGTIQQMVQQQLQQMLGQQGIPTPKPVASTPPKPQPKPKPKEELKEIKRKTKGVTSKMKNYENISASSGMTDAQRAALQKFSEKYIAMTKSSKALTTEHRSYYSDPRAVTGFSGLWKEIVYQIASEKSKGSKIWDIDGNEYIDYVMSYGVALFGHMPDFIATAIQKQVEGGNSLDVLPPKAKEIARMLCEISGKDRITLANTGTEAVVGAVRAARVYSGKERIAVFNTDYHGLVDQFLVRGVPFKDGMRSLPSSVGIPKFHVENVLVLDYDDPNVMDILRANIKDLAGVLIEPIQAQNPHWQHHELLQEIRVLTQETDVPLIFDEVINGFRLNQRGAQAWYGIEADIVAYGKTISGGLPLSAVVGDEKYMRAFDGGLWHFGDDSGPENAITYFASTYIKNPLSVAAAYAAMKEIYDQGPALQEELNKKAAGFAKKVRAIFLRTKAPLFIQNTSSIYMIKTADNNPLTRLFHYYLRFRGVNMRERPCFISTAHTEEDFEKTYAAIEGAINDMFADGMLVPYEGDDLNCIVIPDEVPEPVAQAQTPAPMQAAAQPAAPVVELVATTARETKKITIAEEQQEIWLNSILAPDASKAYNIGTKINLSGNLDIPVLEQAIAALIDRHESLRTTICEDGQHQIVHASRTIELPIEDIRTDRNKERRLIEIEKQTSTTSFDLIEGPLIRFCLVHIEDTQYQLIIAVHHIICDGWSLGNVSKDLGVLYSQLKNHEAKALATPKQLSQYVQEGMDWKATEGFKKNEQYWVKQFEDKVPVFDIPTDFPRPPIKTYYGRVETHILSEELTAEIRKKAAKEGTTFFFFMMAAFKAFMYRLSNQDDFVTGLAVAGHNMPGNSEFVGHAIHFLPLRSRINGEASFATHLKKVRGGILDAFDHQNYTFGSLMKQLKISRNASRNALISVAFNMDSPTGKYTYGDLEVGVEPLPKQFETFDIFFNLKPVDKTVHLEWNFNTDLFAVQTIKNRLGEFECFIQSLLEDFQRSISDFEIVPEAEKKQILNLGKGPEANFPLEECLHRLFEAQTSKTPKKIAVRYGANAISYWELNSRANRLARYLVKRGFTSGNRIGVYLDRSIDLMVSIYAVLKAGGSYVPLDPLNPNQRIELMIEDAQTQFVMTTSDLKANISIKEEQWVIIDEEIFEHLESDNLDLKIPSETEAYVIYTSGSTGRPKGVGVRHLSAVNTLFGINQHLEMDESDLMYSVSSMGFDMSIPDFFLTLITGATLVLAEAEVKKDGFLMKKDLERYEPSIMQATPTTWKILLLSGWKGHEGLTAIAGGEGFPKDLAQVMASKCRAVWNGYGPTETTIYATYKLASSDYLRKLNSKSFAAIGKAIANMELFVLDGNHKLVPMGIPGELYIGGPGVSKGYLNRPELTEKVFIDTAWSDSKLYKTGDLVRMLPNGDIDFLGRVDHQVKIRGFRIELGEIEESIKEEANITQCAVAVAKDTSDRERLVAYVSLKEGTKIDEQEIQTRIRKKLPGYMVPKVFVLLNKFPMTASLKIDRKALPSPDFTSVGGGAAVTNLPQTSSEKLIAGIWQNILGLPKIDLNSDFFELGGHSLAAVELMAKIKQETGKELPLTTLFQNATIKKLAALVADGDAQEEALWSSLVPIRTGGNKPPLYLVHGGGLHVLFYQTLIQHLDPDQPIYALQARGLNGKEQPLDTIEEMAAHYIKEITMQNPNGPYYLAGYSLGGLIAYEMADLFLKQGKKVPFLGMFDAVAKDNNNKNFAQRLIKKLNKTTYNIALVVSRPGKTIKYKKNVLSMKLKENKIAFKDQDSDAVEESYSPMSKLVYEKSLEAFEKYTMRPLPVQIQLFKAKDQMFYLEDFRYLGWQKYAQKGVNLYVVDGDHHTMFDSEYGKKLAKKVQMCLDRVNEETRKEETVDFK